MTPKTEILIIGSGLIGASLAYYLSKAGVQVTLVEARPQPAASGTASWGSAGIISPPARLHIPTPLLTLTQRSIALYPSLIAELPGETGYREPGQLSLAANGAEVRGLQKRQVWQQEVGFVANWLSPAEVSELEPLAGPNAGALYNPAAVVDPPALTSALVQAAQNNGAQLVMANSATNLLLENGQVVGVGLLSGDRYLADRTVLAGGAWSGTWLAAQLTLLGLATQDFERRVWPVRGQMLAITPPSDTSLKHVLVGGHGYAVPQASGLIYYGATVEPTAGYELALTPAGLLELGRLVHKLTPTLDNAPIAWNWSALRPGSTDELPLLGPLPELPGLWLSTGHFRNGVLLAPASAELLAAALQSDQPALPPEFLPNRV